MMKTLKQLYLVILTVIALSCGGFLLWASQHYVTPILMYHQIADMDEYRSDTVTPEAFEKQVAFLKNHGYHVTTLDELVAARAKGESLPRKSVVITFDDGYENNYTNAFPVLKKYEVPAIIFIPTDHINKEGFLEPLQIYDMLDSGYITFGSHSVSHAYLPDQTPDQQRFEISASKKILERMLNRPVNHFAYPVGGFSESIKAIVRQAGYQTAVATNRGYDRFNHDLFELNRVSMRDRDRSPVSLWAKFSGYYNLFRKSKSPY